MKPRDGGSGIKWALSWIFAVVFLLAAFNGMVAVADENASASQESIESFDLGEYISGRLTKNWLAVSDFYAGAPVVYLNQDTQLFIGIMNTGGNAGDDDYIACISQARADAADLLASTNRQSAKNMLSKAIQELDAALVSVENNQRLDSLENVKKAITFLDNAGKMGVDTSGVISDLATGTMLKISTVINEATSNFGSEHPDVKDAKAIYNSALSKYESGKITAAMSEFKNAFEAVLGAYECNVQLTLFDIIPKQSETVIAEPVIQNLAAETIGSIEVIWHPTQRGIHYVRLNMTGEYDVYSSPGETVESPPTILSAGFPVSQATDEWVNWTFGKTIFDGETFSYPSVGKTATLIKVELGNLIIKDGGTLIFNDSVTLVIMQDEEFYPTPIYGITIESGGQFLINSPSRSTAIQSSSDLWELTYPFLNSGTINFLGATVWYTHGPSDLSLAGGIQNLGGSVCILDDCNLLDADTHSLYIGAGADVQVRGAGTVIGSSVSGSVQAKGHGIFVNGATPVIEDVTVQYQKQDGIRVENAVGGAPITAAELQNYASGAYDYRLTYAAGTSKAPAMDSNGDVTYLVWIDDRTGNGELYFKKTHDAGKTWSADERLTFSQEPEFVRYVDIASDGENVVVVAKRQP